MKKFISKIMISLVCIFCLITTFGCSCSKKFDVYYSVNVTEGEGVEFDENLSVKVEVIKKFREPKNTPCYKKVDEGYELIEDASEISKCYTSEGEEFEKATHKLVESQVLDTFTPIYIVNEGQKKPSSYSSESIEFPLEYALIYKFTLRNYDIDGNNDLYVKVMGVSDVVGASVNEESLEKVKVNIPTGNIVTKNNEEYLKIEPDERIEITVELKGLTAKDLTSEADGKINIALNLFVTK